MSEGDPYPKVKRAFTKELKAGLEHFGFSQYKGTSYFIRDRDNVRDVVFFQKMRSHAFCLCYGMSPKPGGDDWSPGIKVHRWLDDQRFYRCKYVEHAVKTAGDALAAFEREALPWLDANTDL